jgi:uncharacterized membrane protein (UPF0136 family)
MSPHGVVILGQIALGVYALLLAVGGTIGYAKAGSRPSLIAGAASAVVALLALGLTWLGGLGFWLGLVLALVLTIVFAIRLRKTGKMMPAGMLCGLSVVMIGLMTWALRNLG